MTEIIYNKQQRDAKLYDLNTMVESISNGTMKVDSCVCCWLETNIRCLEEMTFDKETKSIK
jgi:hypothetical protein